jgi:hypothetical protein
MHQNKKSLIWIAVSFVVLCIVGFLLYEVIRALVRVLSSNEQLVRALGVVVSIASLCVSLVLTLFVNLFWNYLRKPRFRVGYGEGPPWQIYTTADTTELLHVRLRVQNVGRTQEEACEVRIEEVSRLLSDGKLQPINEHDPRPLKWVGRETKPIALNSGAFDFVDLGVRRQDSRGYFRLEFADRGRLDLWLNQNDAVGFRISGTVYGKEAEPRSFLFDLSWKPSEPGPVNVKEL